MSIPIVGVLDVKINETMLLSFVGVFCCVPSSISFA